MAKYQIVAPCIYSSGGKIIHHTEPGATVELDEAQAKLLGNSVERVEAPAPKIVQPRRKGDDDQ